jgi:hypothetical protein
LNPRRFASTRRHRPAEPSVALVDQVASDLAIADGYDPNRYAPGGWSERRDHYEFLAKVAIAAIARWELTKDAERNGEYA